MDHHDDWSWAEGEHDGLGDGDTADLGTPDHLGALDGHDHLDGYEGDHDGGYTDHTPAQPDMSHGPDLAYESGDLDVPHHDPGPDLTPHGHYDDVPVDEHHDSGAEHVDHLVGVDPDTHGDHDGVWHADDFPPPLELDARPEPADGYPWSDPDTLGDPGTLPDADHVDAGFGGGAPFGDLFAYAGMDAAPPGVDPWSLLLGSDDPATSSLARWWGPAS